MITPDGKRVYVQEVAPRDGLQIEAKFIPTQDKVALINGLSRVGLAKIEVTSFTSPRAIPALADAEQVMQQIARVPGVEYSALVPNVKGCARALEANVDEINVVISASETHNRANLRMSCGQSFAAIREIAALAHGRVHVNVSISTAFGCPFEGDVSPEQIKRFVDELSETGIKRMSLCDTTGMANPLQVYNLFAQVRAGWPGVELTAHFHDTRSMALANALAALEAGVNRFDASLGGLGGCPFAPGASGNACTEDVTHMFAMMGYRTGVNLEELIELARGLPALVGHDVPGQIMKAGPSTRRYPVPASGAPAAPACETEIPQAQQRFPVSGGRTPT